MAYTKTNWEDAPSTATPLCAENLNKIENGIYENSIDLALADSNINTLTERITAINTALSAKADKTELEDEITDIDETVTMKINLKADKATTLAGYGITDAYDKTYLNKALDSTNAAIEKAKSETDSKLNEINADVNGLKSDLVELNEVLGYEVLDKDVTPIWEEAVDGYYRNISSDGTITNIPVTANSVSRLTLPIAVKKGTTVNVISTNYNSKAIIAFFESEKAEQCTVLAIGAQQKPVKAEYSATIEKDGFIVVTCCKASIDKVKIHLRGKWCELSETVEKNTNAIQKINEGLESKAEKSDIEVITNTVGYEVLNEDIVPTWEEAVDGYYAYINADGDRIPIATTAASATRLTLPIKVKVGSVVTFNTAQYNTKAAIAFIENETDKTYTVLSLGADHNHMKELSVTIEKSGFIVVGCHKNTIESVKIHIGGATSKLAIKADENTKRIEKIEKSMNVIENTVYPEFSTVTTTRGSHDCTFISDKIVSFNKPSDGYAHVLDASTLQMEKRIQINFTEPHSQKELEMKSCDYRYSKLLVGNGRAIKYGETSYLEQGSKLYVFYEADAWLDTTGKITLDNCGLYDVIDISELGYKVYGFWGQFDDCVFVSCNLFNDVYLIQLGKGSTNLGRGVYTEAEDSRYNGSYTIIKNWHQDGKLGEWAAHGGQYYKGNLYLATNNSSLCTVYKCNLKFDGTLFFDLLDFNIIDSGDLKYKYIDGLCIKDNILYAQPLYGDNNKAIIVAKI